MLAAVGVTGGGGIAVRAQAPSSVTVQGEVTDAETGQPLPQANLRIEGTYRGTITNADGEYTLRVDSLPATLVVQYLGYESARRRLTTSSSTRQSFQLTPSTLEMDEVVVTGSRNPGASIMRKVIERKQEWWPELKRYTVEAYTRFTLARDTTIAAVAESRTTAFWDAERGTREIVRSQRGTANIAQFTEEAFPAASSVLNLYRDNVKVFGNRMIGVTHPDALDHYTFTLDTLRAIDGRRAFRILVEPKRRLSSTFEGTVTVLDRSYALLEARLRPTMSLSTSRVLKKVDLEFEQSFSSFGGDYWLPVDFRARRNFGIQLSALLSFSGVALRQVSRLSDYQINVPLPDSLYESDAENSVLAGEEPTSLDSTDVDPDSLHRSGPFVPYSQAERLAYARIDSTDALENTFEPGGLLGWLQDVGVIDGLLDGDSGGETDSDESDGQDEDSSETSSSGDSVEVDVSGVPILRYNRVEEAHFGGRLNVGLGPLEVTARAGHNTGPSGPTRWTYGGTAEWRVDSRRTLQVSYRYGIEPRYRARSRMAPIWATLSNSFWTLAGEPDYFDYFGNERMRLSIEQDVPDWDLDLELEFRNERQFSVGKSTEYDLGARGLVQPPNPPVDEGWLRSVALTATLGDGGLLGVLPINRMEASVEHSNSDVVVSDFDVTRLEVVADAHIETFFQRRFLPNALDLRLDAATSLGKQPLQRFGVVEASPLPYTPFGALRTLDDRPYQGEHHVAFFWEHNFRTVPFELIGWSWPVERNIDLIVHGGHGRTWIESDTQRRLRRRGVALRATADLHHELGLSINGLLYDSLRLDVTRRLDAPGFSIGVSLLRFL